MTFGGFSIFIQLNPVASTCRLRWAPAQYSLLFELFIRLKNYSAYTDMPTYVYQIVNDDGTDGEIFEVQQSMSEPALTQHPKTGQELRRVYSPPNVSAKYTPGRTAKLTGSKSVENAGFTRYERDKLTGRYHKTAGKDKRAPELLNP